jgi:succinate dehydrogenase / fumarate reductase cytochrome b subunit
VGLIIVSRGKRNVWHYPYPENIRYTLQRGTGVIAFAFIIWHVFQMHGWFHFPWWSEHVLKPFGGGLFVPAHAPATAAAVIQSSTLVLALYAVGVLACAYHLADGVWTAGITWGVWTSPRAQRAMTRVCAAFGLGLAVLGLGALYAMETVPLSLPPVSTEAIESRASGPRQTPQPAGVVRRRIAEAANPFRVKGTVPFSSTIAARWCPRKLGQSPAKGGGP